MGYRAVERKGCVLAGTGQWVDGGELGAWEKVYYEKNVHISSHFRIITLPALLPKTQVIRKVLSPAVRLWLRSQVESAEQLQFQIEGSDRQLLSGQIPQVFVLGDTVVYQGLRLTRIEMTGQDIQVNLKRILRGHALQLLQPITVLATLALAETDLNACLQSPLLAEVLTKLLDQWLQPLRTQPEPALLNGQPHQWQQIRIAFAPDTLSLEATLIREGQPDLLVEMRAIVQLINHNTLVLKELKWNSNAEVVQTALETLDQLTLDLGSDVAMESLSLEQGQVSCQGQILIRP